MNIFLRFLLVLITALVASCGNEKGPALIATDWVIIEATSYASKPAPDYGIFEVRSDVLSQDLSLMVTRSLSGPSRVYRRVKGKASRQLDEAEVAGVRSAFVARRNALLEKKQTGRLDDNERQILYELQLVFLEGRN